MFIASVTFIFHVYVYFGRNKEQTWYQMNSIVIYDINIVTV